MAQIRYHCPPLFLCNPEPLVLPPRRSECCDREAAPNRSGSNNIYSDVLSASHRNTLTPPPVPPPDHATIQPQPMYLSLLVMEVIVAQRAVLIEISSSLCDKS